MAGLLKKICSRCNGHNWYDSSIVHVDSVANETNPLRHHCTFCTHPLD